ncbi:uncharacterized protein LOC141610630 isoform X2 [Silene latifolia]
MDFCATFLPTGFLNGGGYISRLKRLELAMPRQAVLESVNYPLEFPETLNLEELKIDIYGEQEACCLWPVVLIKAAPFLRKFSVKVRFRPSISLGQIYDVAAQRIREAAKTVRHHQYLKTIDLFDYLGDPNELELAQHLFRVSDVLEQVIVSPRFIDTECISEINFRVQALAAWLPPPKAILTVL